MNVKIAVFGRKQIVDRLLKMADNKVQLLPFVYSEKEDINDLIDKAVMCDVYLFTNPLDRLSAKDKIDREKLPALHIPIDAYTVLAAFYDLHKTSENCFPRVSLDIDDRHTAETVIKEQALTSDHFYIYSYNENQVMNIDEAAFFHKNLWKSGHIDTVLTISPTVKQRLATNNIPAVLMQAPDINLTNAIQETRALAKLNSHANTQTVAGYVRLRKQSADRQASTEDLHILKMLLDDFSHVTNAAVIPAQDQSFAIFGTRKLLDYLTANYRQFFLLTEAQKSITGTVEIGFGLGLHADQATYFAQQALDACKHQLKSSCFIVNERGKKLGPVGVKRTVDHATLYQALIHKARLNNELSYNFLDFITKRNNEPFSSQDLASFYGVTKRSAERTLGKLIKGEVIKVVGEEKPYLRGRPRKLFQINQ